MRDDEVVRETEGWFIRRGLPHFIEGYSAARDIWTRALPALTLLFVVEIAVNAPNREFPIWLDIVVVAAAFAVLLGGWAFVNRRRGRRPLARPDTVGPFEVAAFVLVAPLVPLVLGGQVRAAVVTALGNCVVLGMIYVSTSYGVLAMTRWGLGRLFQQLEAITSLLARALPMIALLVTFLFLTGEVWQTAGSVDGPAYWMALGVFGLVAAVFVIARLPRDIGELNHFDEDNPIGPFLAATPMERVAADTAADDAPALGRREWGNVGLVALFSQGVQIALVSVLIGAFFVLLGLLLVDEATTTGWAMEANVLATVSLGQRDLVLTEQLLRVAGFVTAFAALNFTVVLLTDETYRKEFREEIVTELRQAFAVRAAYRAYLAGGAPNPSATISPT